VKTVRNKTHGPLKVPLPRNKFLRLGPNTTGQIRDDDAERPAVKRMLDAGEIEIVAAGAHGSGASGHEAAAPRAGRSGGGATRVHRSGDR